MLLEYCLRINNVAEVFCSVCIYLCCVHVVAAINIARRNTS